MVQKGEVEIPGYMQARDVLDILTLQCQELGVVTSAARLSTSITGRGWFFCGLCWWQLSLHAVGDSHRGISYPATGSSGDGYRFAGILGHQLSGSVRL